MIHVLRLFLICSICILVGCKESSKSRVISNSFFSEIANDSINYKVYLSSPVKNDNKLFVLYLLHGHGGSEKDWFKPDEGNIQHLLDSIAAINQREILAVSIDGKNSWYVNSRVQEMESIYIKEFIPYFEKNYVQSGNSERIIVGNSAGGYGALRFSIVYPELFSNSILLAPASYYPSPPDISSSRKIEVFKVSGVFNDSLWQSYSHVALLEKNNTIKNYPKLYISTGDDDPYGIFNVVYDLREFLAKENINNEITVIDGEHSWDVWRECFSRDLVRVLNSSND